MNEPTKDLQKQCPHEMLHLEVVRDVPRYVCADCGKPSRVFKADDDTRDPLVLSATRGRTKTIAALAQDLAEAEARAAELEREVGILTASLQMTERMIAGDLARAAERAAKRRPR